MKRTQKPATLNDAQQRHLRITCKYIDGLLCDIEHALHTRESKSPFPHYVVDVTPAQVRLIEVNIRSLRAQLLKTLDWQHMKPEPPEIPVSHLVITDLGFVENAIEELKPRSMRGYGAVPEDAIGGLDQVVDELGTLAQRIERSIREELGLNQNLQCSEPEKTGEEE
jgi:hypothetical protein